MLRVKKQALKGTVLFTVVSVMSLLLVFLLSALVLATSANNRAHKSYTTSQTQYTARTAVDSVFKAIGGSQDFADSIDALSSANKGPMNVSVDIEADAASMGKLESVTVEWVGNKQFYNESKRKWETKDLLRITAIANLAGERSTCSSYILKDPPMSNTTTGGGAGFVTAGGASTSNHTSAFGGTYLNIREFVEDPGSTTQTPYEDLTYDPLTKNYLTGDSYFLGNAQVIEADCVVNGNLKINSAADFVFPNPGTGVSVWGDFTTDNAKERFISENVKNGMSLAYNKVPYFYVDGVIHATLGLHLGDGSFPMNTFCGSIEATNGTPDIHSDLYCMDDAVSKFEGNGLQTKLSTWNDSWINKTVSKDPINHVYGSIYSNGDLVINSASFEVEGDVRVVGDLTINSGAIIKGDVVVGGTLTVNTDKEVSLGVTSGKKLYTDQTPIVVNANNFYVAGYKYGVSSPDPTCTVVTNIDHPAETVTNPGYTKVDNIPLYYQYKVNKTDSSLPNFNKGLHGEDASQVDYLYYPYVTYDESKPYDPDLKGENTSVIDTSKDGLYAARDWAELNKGIYKWITATGTNLIDDSTNTEKRTNKPCWYYDNSDPTQEVEPNIATTIKPAYKTVAKKDGTDSGVVTTEAQTYYNASGAIIPASMAFVTVSAYPLESYQDAERNNSSKIYPPEMMKEVILGIQQIKGYDAAGNYNLLPVTDTQIVKTVKDVVKSAINPYTAAKYEIPATYQSDVNANVYTPHDDGSKAFLVDASGKPVGDSDANPITKSCTINGGDITTDVYFSPTDGSEIWVKVNGNVSLLEKGGNGKFIFVDQNIDTTDPSKTSPKLNSTKLNFLLTNGSSINMNKGEIITTTLKSLLENNKTISINNYPLATPTGATEINSPQLYIYSEKGATTKDMTATIKLENSALITGHIKAPYLDASIKNVQSFPYNSDIYYNGIKITNYDNTLSDHNTGEKGNFKVGNNDPVMTKLFPIIGSMNVGQGSFDNGWTLLYVDPNKGGGAPIITPSGNHWYLVTYYDQY